MHSTQLAPDAIIAILLASCWWCKPFLDEKVGTMYVTSKLCDLLGTHGNLCYMHSMLTLKTKVLHFVIKVQL